MISGCGYWCATTEANDTTLRTFLRYSHDQGLVDRRFEPKELFAPETFEAFKI